MADGKDKKDDLGRVYDKKTGEWVSEKELARRKTKRRVDAAEKVGGAVGKGVGFVASKTYDVTKLAAKKAAPHVKKAAKAAKEKTKQALADIHEAQSQKATSSGDSTQSSESNG